MPDLLVVLLQGRHAQAGWHLMVRAHSSLVEERRLTVETYHPGQQALWHPDPAVRAARSEHRVRAYAAVAAALSG